MAKKDSEQKQVEGPRYSIGEIMALIDEDERTVRKLLVDAGVDVNPAITDPGEKIAYPDYRNLWISRANRPEGRKLETLLVEESNKGFDGLFKL